MKGEVHAVVTPQTIDHLARQTAATFLPPLFRPDLKGSKGPALHEASDKDRAVSPVAVPRLLHYKAPRQEK